MRVQTKAIDLHIGDVLEYKSGNTAAVEQLLDDGMDIHINLSDGSYRIIPASQAVTVVGRNNVRIYADRGLKFQLYGTPIVEVRD